MNTREEKVTYSTTQETKTFKNAVSNNRWVVGYDKSPCLISLQKRSEYSRDYTSFSIFRVKHYNQCPI